VSCLQFFDLDLAIDGLLEPLHPALGGRDKDTAAEKSDRRVGALSRGLLKPTDLRVGWQHGNLRRVEGEHQTARPHAKLSIELDANSQRAEIPDDAATVHALLSKRPRHGKRTVQSDGPSTIEEGTPASPIVRVHAASDPQD